MAKRKTPAPLLVEQVPRDDGRGTLAAVTAAGRETARRMAAEGCPQALIAAVLGLPRRTLRDCIDRDTALADEVAAGKAENERELVQLLMAQAREGYAPAAMFLLKSMHGHRETGPSDGAHQAVQVNISIPPPMSQDEFRAIVDGQAEAAS